MNRNVYFIIILFASMSFQQVRTQTCSSGGVPLTGNAGLHVTEGRALQLGFAYDHNVLKDLMFENFELDDDSRIRSTKSIFLQAGYAFNKYLSIRVLFLYVHQFREITHTF